MHWQAMDDRCPGRLCTKKNTDFIGCRVETMSSYVDVYKRFRNNLCYRIREARESYFNYKFNSFMNDSKSTWKTINGSYIEAQSWWRELWTEGR